MNNIYKTYASVFLATIGGATGFGALDLVSNGQYKEAIFFGAFALGSVTIANFSSFSLGKKINELEEKVANYEIKDK